jgi:hypothetical protein
MEREADHSPTSNAEAWNLLSLAFTLSLSLSFSYFVA